MTAGDDGRNFLAVSILGNPVRRVEDPLLLTVGGRYVADEPLEGALHVVFVRSTVAHGRITGIDTAGAVAADGVVCVITAADLGLQPHMPPEFAALINPQMVRPWLAQDVVRFVGEPVAAVVAETAALAVDAAGLVVVDYDPLPVVLDPLTAATADTLLFPAAGTNVAATFGAPVGGAGGGEAGDAGGAGGAGDAGDDFFAGCDVVIRLRTLNSKVAPAPLEPRAAASTWGDDGRLTHWTGTQRPHHVRDGMAAVLGVDATDIRVVTHDVGGAFGARMYPSAEEVVVAWAARSLHRPVRWTETRSENLMALGHGRAQVQDIEMGGSRDGRITAYRLHMTQDAGAYPEVAALLPGFSGLMASGVYAIERIATSATSVATNTSPVTAYRGAGRPEATAAVERAIDRFAAEIGMDPAEVRRRNIIPADAFPYTTATGATYDSGDYGRALDLALTMVDYEAVRAEQAERRARGDVVQLGIGLCLYTEITNGTLFPQFARATVGAGGAVTIFTGEGPTGQGHDTAWAMLAADRLGVPMERVTVMHGDTDLVASGTGTGGSAAVQTGGVAIAMATDDLIVQARERSAQRLEANVDDVVFDQANGRFHVAGSPSAGHTWAELAAPVDGDGRRGPEPPGELAAEVTFQPTNPTFPFGAHVVVVEVDMETGGVRIRRVVAVDDAGRILNPLLAEGQVHGGIAQGLAQALQEEVSYDSDGNLLTGTFADYLAITATDLPSFELAFTETPTDQNVLGAKGIGESGTIGSTPALQHAVIDALAHLGVRHVDMPTTPERVWRAIQQVKHTRGGT